MDNLELNEDNIPPNPLNENYQEISLNEFDILSIYINFVPSLIYSIIIALILIIPQNDNQEEYLSQAHHIILYLKLILVIYMLYIIKGLFIYFIMAKEKIKNINPKIFVQICFIILDISYIVFTIAGSLSYRKLSLDFIINNIYKCIFIYILLFIGITHIFLFVTDILYLLIFFVISLADFLRDENEFIHQHPGISKIIINFQKRQKADKNHLGTCPICLGDFIEGVPLIILNCSDKHYFHEECINKWFEISSCCPLCKNHRLL